MKLKTHVIICLTFLSILFLSLSFTAEKGKIGAPLAIATITMTTTAILIANRPSGTKPKQHPKEKQST